MTHDNKEINLVEASIKDLERALDSGHITSVELVARYLRRISTYDCQGLSLNAIPILNNDAFAEAAASDDRRAAGKKLSPLEGIPYTIKDSYKVKGMTAAAGSPAFKDLVSNEDAAIVASIRASGGVLIGRTNMPAMACGGMQRGIYGRAENPYNPDYLAAAFASGSSNGSAVSTAASFAAFGIGAETVSSGRSPASNNALIAYTPSRGWLSGRGNWPLYPTCDVPVPHTRTVRDLLYLLDVITVEDPAKDGDFWREQTFIKLPDPWQGRPLHSFKEISSSVSLSGLRIAVPLMYLGGPTPPGAAAVYTNPAVVELFERVRKDIEALGAEIVETPDFPAVTAYENDELLPAGCPRRPANWGAMERGPLIAHAWNDFIKTFDNAALPDLFAVDTSQIYPEWLRTEPELKHFETANGIMYHTLKDILQRGSHRPARGFSVIDGLEEAILALEGMRRHLLEDWLTDLGCDCALFPAAGDVGRADSDSNFQSAAHTWQNGVRYSNGNRAIRHLGIPTVSVPMGTMRDTCVPISLTFAGRAGSDVQLLKWANAFESKTRHRVAPLHAPALTSDRIAIPDGPSPTVYEQRPDLNVEEAKITNQSNTAYCVTLRGSISVEPPTSTCPVLDVTINALPVPPDMIETDTKPQLLDGKAVFGFRVSQTVKLHSPKAGFMKTWATTASDKTMVVISARNSFSNRPTGWLRLI
jgi:Asp-tRNA(Asn)/Glu-tRNA(Gln) amidotransferase A subunit family amidase